MIVRPKSAAGGSTLDRAGPPDSLGAPASIAAWLHALARRMNVPASERRAVCDELDAHLRQRVQELMLCGLSEAKATADAIEELGDADELAGRYTQAYSHPRRRRIMQIGLLGIAGAAVVTAIVTFNGPGSVIPTSAFQPAREEAPAALRDIKVSADLSLRWDNFFRAIGQGAKLPVFVHWPQLRALGGGDAEAISPDNGIGVELQGFSLDAAITLLNDHANLSSDSGVAYRVQEGRIVFSSQAFFDRQETVLVTYDLASAIGARKSDLDNGATTQEVVDSIRQLVTALVHPDLWAENGGDLARMQTYGTKLFVSAPSRLQPQVQWVLAEMATAGPKDNAVRGAAADTGELQMRAFPLKHVGASEALCVIKSLHSLQPVDFTKAASDPGRNSIIVQGSADLLDRVGAAIDAIDRPVAQEGKPVSMLDPRFQIRAAGGGGLVIRAMDGTELRCEELNIDPEAGMQAVPVGAKGERVPVLGDLPILNNMFTTPARTVPLRELPRE
ncbi:MAG: permease prefix domain 1-containing protein [Phycisphaerales bacterium]